MGGDSRTHAPTRVGKGGADGELLARVRRRVQAEELGQAPAVEGADEDLQDREDGEDDEGRLVPRGVGERPVC